MTGRSQIWDGSQWINLSNNPGSKGETGATGPPGEGGELSTDADNQLILGSDSLHYCPEFADGVYLKLAGGLMAGTLDMGGNVIGNISVLLTFTGSPSAPSYAFASESNTGMYRISGGALGFSVSGALILDLSGTALKGNSTIGGVQIRMQVEGNALAPIYTFFGDTTTGIYRAAANQIGFSTGGQVKLTISSTLNLFEHPIHVKESTFGVAHYRLDDDAFRASPVFDNTVTTASTVFVTTGGVLMRSTAINVAVDATEQATMDTRIGQSFFDNTLEAVDLAALTNYILDRIDALEAFHP